VAAGGGGSDTEYESYDDDDDDDEVLRETEHCEPISDHDDIQLPQ